MRLGASGYLTKPFDPMTLHEQILDILEKKKVPVNYDRSFAKNAPRFANVRHLGGGLGEPCIVVNAALSERVNIDHETVRKPCVGTFFGVRQVVRVGYTIAFVPPGFPARRRRDSFPGSRMEGGHTDCALARRQRTITRRSGTYCSRLYGYHDLSLEKTTLIK